MNFEFKCPQCGNAVAVDESYRGQVVECPHCTRGIVVPKSKSNDEARRQTIKVIQIQCPHCGAEYEATKQDMHHQVSCEMCGKDFVIGETFRAKSAGAQPTQTDIAIADDNASSKQRTRKTKRAVLIAASAVCMIVMLTAVFILGRYSGKPDTSAQVATAIEGDTSAKPKESESANSVNNETRVKTPEGPTVETGTDTLSQTKQEEVKTSNDEIIPINPTPLPAKTVARAEGKEGDKPKGNGDESVVTARNEASEKSPEEPILETDADTVPKTGQEEVTTSNDETEPLVKPSLEMSGERTPGAESGALFGETKLKGKNPLELFHFGDAPRGKLSNKNTVQYEISDFLGFQQLILGYTKKGHLFSICLISENDHCSATESDARVSKLMQLCDEWIENIKWDLGEQEHDGRKFAIGRINETHYDTPKPHQAKKNEIVKKWWLPSHRLGAGPNEGKWWSTVYNYRDIVLSIVPTRGERNIVGLQVNLVDNRLRRLEKDYLSLDVRRPVRVNDTLYEKAKSWLKEQRDRNSLKEHQVERYYDGNNLYAYCYILDRGLDDDHRQVQITLEGGVLKLGGGMPISESYAEELITAKIIVMNRIFEGIEGPIYDNRPYGPGGHVVLPCPICKGDESKQHGKCMCWSESRNKNTGKGPHINKQEFEEKLYEYKMGRWHPQKKTSKEKTKREPRQPPRRPVSTRKR